MYIFIILKNITRAQFKYKIYYKKSKVLWYMIKKYIDRLFNWLLYKVLSKSNKHSLYILSYIFAKQHDAPPLQSSQPTTTRRPTTTSDCCFQFLLIVAG